MNKKFIALTVLAFLAEESSALAQGYVTSQAYSNGEVYAASNGNGDCCPAPRPASCQRPRRLRMLSTPI